MPDDPRPPTVGPVPDAVPREADDVAIVLRPGLPVRPATSRDRDSAARSPTFDAGYGPPAPEPGERCSRCHRRDSVEQGIPCALCSPIGPAAANAPDRAADVLDLFRGSHVERRRIPTIPPGRATAPGRMQGPHVEPDHLTPAAMRLLSSGIGAMREIIGDGCTSAIPPLDVAYLDHGRFSVAVVLTGPVARLNEYAATEALSNGERRVLEVLTLATWMSVEEVAAAARMDTADTLASLRALWRAQLAIVTAGQWRRAEK